jgi:branched-chain amino acid transport system ATP-binding protein
VTEPLLTVVGLCAGYGDVAVLHDVDIAVDKGEIVCLIGSNGAGKTTLLRAISAMVRPTTGRVNFADRDLSSAEPKAAVRAGIAHVPEGRRLFAGMTVRENLLVGAYLRHGEAVAIRRDLDLVLTTFPRLGERIGQDASTLSGGEQQMCAIGRGLMSAPKLLMIDELSLGLAPRIVDELVEKLHGINRQGMSILVVEQDVAIALELASRGFVIDTGRIVASGKTSDLAASPDIRRAYLGDTLQLTS